MPGRGGATIAVWICFAVWGNLACLHGGDRDVSDSGGGLLGRLTYIRYGCTFGSKSGRDIVERMDLRTRETETLLSSDYPVCRLRYSPDKKRFVFEMDRTRAGDRVHTGKRIYIGFTDGAAAIELTENSRPDTFPEWSPDGKYIAYEDGPWEISAVRVIDVESRLDEPVMAPEDTATCKPLWLTNTTLLVHTRLDARVSGTKAALRTSGMAKYDIREKIFTRMFDGLRASAISLSPDGVHLAVSTPPRVKRPGLLMLLMGGHEYIQRLQVLDLASGRLEPMNPQPGMYESNGCVAWSPGGSKLAWIRTHKRRSQCQVLVRELGKRGVKKISLPNLLGGSLRWSRDGAYLACVTHDRVGGGFNVYAANVLAGSSIRVLSSPSQIGLFSWD